jgi:hypothetical protein
MRIMLRALRTTLTLVVPCLLACGHRLGDGSMPSVDASTPTVDASVPAEQMASVTDNNRVALPAAEGVGAVGLSWPADQSFPSFAPITALDVIDIDGRPSDEVTLLATLEGLVNRVQPRIYLLSTQGEGKTFWIDRIIAAKTPVSTTLNLVAKYAAEIKGVVIVDPAQVDTVNLATTIAGIESAIVASPALGTQLQAPPYNLPVIADLRTNHFASNLEVYQYALDHYASLASRRLIVGITGHNASGPRDLAVATAAVVLWLDPTVPAELSLLQKFFSRMETNSPYLGWWTNEGAGVTAASKAGLPTFAGDYSYNLSVLSGTPRAIRVPAPPLPPVLANKIYVSIFMSDGDNLQINQHALPMKWQDPNRGKVPIAWTVDAALVDVAPVILDYLWSTASPNDVLVSGPSGLGYTYPADWLAGSFEQYARRTGNYLSAAGLRAITVWNNGPDLTSVYAAAYVNDLPRVLGVTMQSSTQSFQLLGATLPVVRFTQAYARDENDLEAAIDGGTVGWPGNAPRFIAVQGNLNKPTISPTAFYNVQQKYEADPNIVFVRGDHFFQLIRQANGLPIEPSTIARGPMGDFDGDGRADYADRSIVDGTIRVWLNRATGFVATPSFTRVSAAGPELASVIGDFNGDGKADYADHSRVDGHLVVHLNTGSGFNPTAYEQADTARTPRWQTLIGDFDGDGLADYADRAFDTGALFVHLNTGTGFSTANFETATTMGGPSWETLVGDFDGDGLADYADHQLTDGHLFVHRNLGTGFDPAVSEEAVTQQGPQWETLIGDFDGDHRADYADHDRSGGQLLVHRNLGSVFDSPVYEQTLTPVSPTLESLSVAR